MLPDPEKHAFFLDEEVEESSDIVSRTGEWCGRLWRKITTCIIRRLDDEQE